MGERSYLTATMRASGEQGALLVIGESLGAQGYCCTVYDQDEEAMWVFGYELGVMCLFKGHF